MATTLRLTVMRKSILKSNSDNDAFDPETTAAMAMALETVCKALRIKGNPAARQVIAARIIELARRGERDARKQQGIDGGGWQRPLVPLPRHASKIIRCDPGSVAQDGL